MISSSQTPLPTQRTSMPPAGFEPVIPAMQRPQTYASNHTATGIDPFLRNLGRNHRRLWNKTRGMQRCWQRPSGDINERTTPFDIKFLSCFSTQHKPVGVCNGNGVSSELWSIIYTKFRLQTFLHRVVTAFVWTPAVGLVYFIYRSMCWGFNTTATMTRTAPHLLTVHAGNWLHIWWPFTIMDTLLEDFSHL